MRKDPIILSIESSCDETSAAVLRGQVVLSNIIASQKIHEKYGGVVPELASRAHQANIVPVVSQSLNEAGIQLNQLDAIAFTQGPGLMGALLVGTSFAKSLSLSLNIPLIAVHHMEAHVLAHFVESSPKKEYPEFPFLCLTVSGGHTQIVRVDAPNRMMVVGETIDDAAGEAFDKAAKILGLPYPGGPQIDKLAGSGDMNKFHFTTPRIADFNFSFSGLKTNLLYFLRDSQKENPQFIEQEKNNICASYQHTIVNYLLQKLSLAAKHYEIKDICLAGGVSANSHLREMFNEMCERNHWRSFIPDFVLCTDNAAMIGVSAYFKFLAGEFSNMEITPQPNWKMNS